MSQTTKFIQQFNASATTNVTAAVSQASGGAVALIVGGWVKYAGVTGNALQDGTTGVYCSTSGTGLAGFTYNYYSNASLGTVNQKVVVPLKFYTSAGGSCYTSVLLGCSATGANTDFYNIGIAGNAGNTGTGYNIGKFQAGASGSFTTVTYYNGAGATTTVVGTPSASETRTLTLYKTVAGGTVTVVGYENGILAFRAVDSSPSANLQANTGIGIADYATADDATHGTHTGTITVSDYSIATFAATDASINPAAYDFASPMQWNVNTYNSAGIAITNIAGSEINLNFSGTSLAVQFDTSRWFYSSHNAGDGLPCIAVSIDNGPETDLQIPYIGTFNAAGQQPVLLASNLSAGTHSFKLVYLTANAAIYNSISGWKADASNVPPATLVVTNIIVDGGATLSVPTPPTKIMLILGDSISTEDYSSVVAQNPSLSSLTGGTIASGDPRTCYSFRLGDAQGWRTARRTYGGTGYVAYAGTADGAAAAGVLWKNYDSHNAITVSNYNANIGAVVIVHGVNDQFATFTNSSGGTQTNSAATVQTAATALLNDLLTEIPAPTPILVYIPFGHCGANTLGTAWTGASGILGAAIAACSAPGRVSLRDLGNAYTTGVNNNPIGLATYQSADNIHPNTVSHMLLAEAVNKDISSALSPATIAQLPDCIIANDTGDKLVSGNPLTRVLATATGCTTFSA